MKRAKSQFVIWRYAQVDGACMLGALQGVEDSYELRDGIPRAKGFPGKANFRMDPDFPDDTVLIDNLRSENFLIVASLRLSDFVQGIVPGRVEYLPVTILNHKGKVASRDYRLINPIEPIDCLDMELCKAEPDIIDPDSIRSVERLVIKEDKIPEARWMFRPKGLYRVILVRRELADKIKAEKFTGVRWLELDEYPEK
jgi:hypothetical protein